MFFSDDINHGSRINTTNIRRRLSDLGRNLNMTIKRMNSFRIIKLNSKVSTKLKGKFRLRLIFRFTLRLRFG